VEQEESELEEAIHQQSLEEYRGTLLLDNLSFLRVARIGAKLIDFSIISLLTYGLSLFSFWLAVAFCLFGWASIEEWGRRQSPGKWMLGLQLVDMRDNGHSYYHLLIRNFPFWILQLALLFNDSLFFWILAPFAIASLAIEIFFVMTLKSGTRVGDVIGYTRVLEFKDTHTRFLEKYLKTAS